jgi:hypothetical protein
MIARATAKIRRGDKQGHTKQQAAVSIESTFVVNEVTYGNSRETPKRGRGLGVLL